MPFDEKEHRSVANAFVVCTNGFVIQGKLAPYNADEERLYFSGSQTNREEYDTGRMEI